ncbi:MAG: hypothetical protein AAF616_11255 [Bacteroidota bacterium]
MKKYFFLVLLVWLAGCNESVEADPNDLGFDFYPTLVNQYRIYEVEEINFRITGFDTANYQLRETIFDSLVSLDQVTYLIRRDKRDNALEEWRSDSIWTVTPTERFVAVAENNIQFLKLTFPVRPGISWNGNSLNARGLQTYFYEEVSTSTFEEAPLSDQIRLIIEDIPESSVGVDLRSEIYVRGIGLVEKDYLTQVKCTAGSCGADLGKVQGGRLLKQNLIEYGILDEPL